MQFNRDDLNFFYRYCIALTKNEAISYDLLQTGLEKWLRKSIHSQVTNPRQYFLRMIKNQFLDDLKKEGPYQKEEYNDQSNVAEIGTNPLEDILITKEKLSRALKIMNSDERELIFLWAMEGHTIQEIADHLDSPKGTVLARLFRLKKKVQEAFEKDNAKEGL